MNLIFITQEDTAKIQDFIFDVWQYFFDTGTKEMVLEKRKDLQNPIEFYKEHNGNF